MTEDYRASCIGQERDWKRPSSRTFLLEIALYLGRKGLKRTCGREEVIGDQSNVAQDDTTRQERSRQSLEDNDPRSVITLRLKVIYKLTFHRATRLCQESIRVLPVSDITSWDAVSSIERKG